MEKEENLDWRPGHDFVSRRKEGSTIKTATLMR